jgi:hypothetical protein
MSVNMKNENCILSCEGYYVKVPAEPIQSIRKNLEETDARGMDHVHLVANEEERMKDVKLGY